MWKYPGFSDPGSIEAISISKLLVEGDFGYPGFSDPGSIEAAILTPNA